MIFPSVLLQARIAEKTILRFPYCSNIYLKLSGPSQIQCRHFIGRFSRPKLEMLAKTEGSSAKRAYGERILVYYAGKKVVFVATLKLATLLVFSFCTFIAAPSVGIDTDYGYWAPVCS